MVGILVEKEYLSIFGSWAFISKPVKIKALNDNSFSIFPRSLDS